MALPQTGAFPISIQGVVDVNVEDKRYPAGAYRLENMTQKQGKLSPRKGWRVAATLGYNRDGNRPDTLAPSDRELKLQLFPVALGGVWTMVVTDQRGSWWNMEYARAKGDQRQYIGPPIPNEDHTTIQGPYIEGTNRFKSDNTTVTASFINEAGTFNAVTVDGSSQMRVLSVPRTGGSILNVTAIPNLKNTITDDLFPTNDLSYVNSYQNRLVFVQKNSLKLWYTQEVRTVPQLQEPTPIEDFGLDSIFDQGGDILLINKFSLNTGAGRPNMIAITTDQGQTAVYSTVTFDESDIKLHAIPDIGTPLGQYSFCNLGSDIFYASVDGFTSLRGSIDDENRPVYLSDNIQDTWLRYSEQYDQFNVLRAPFREQNLILIVPQGSNDVLVYNYRTNAWGIWKLPEPIESMAVLNRNLFATSKNIIKGFNGGQDELLNETFEIETTPIHFINIPRHVNFGSVTNKSFNQARITMKSDFPVQVIPFMHDFDKPDTQIPVFPQALPQPDETTLSSSELGNTSLSKEPTKTSLPKLIQGNAEMASVGFLGTLDTEKYPNTEFERINPTIEQTNHP